MASICTRSVGQHPVFGATAELPKQNIQTYEDVFKAYCWGFEADEAEPKLMFKRVKMSANVVKYIYTKMSIPSINLQCIAVSIQRLISKAHELKKYPKLKQTSAVFTDKDNSFQKFLNISTCKCYGGGAT